MLMFSLMRLLYVANCKEAIIRALNRIVGSGKFEKHSKGKY